MDFSKYITFEFVDFLTDDYFISYVINPSTAKDQFWNSFLNQYPERKAIVSSAADFIRRYRLQDRFDNQNQQEEVWNRINNTLASQAPVRKRLFTTAAYLRIAAMFFLVSSIGIGYWYYNIPLNVSTVYGEIKTVELPDHSIVTLNGNSSISYARSWTKGPREIWIQGEALFKVRHINIDTLHILLEERFIVHARDLNIEVLGTTFNVKSRHENTKIGLLSGKIRVDFAKQENVKVKSLIMRPGDYVEHAVSAITTRTKLADARKLSKWVNHHLFFKGATLQEISQTLRDDYGYQVNLGADVSPALKIEGEINVSSVKELLDVISSTLHVSVKQDKKIITITN